MLEQGVALVLGTILLVLKFVFVEKFFELLVKVAHAWKNGCIALAGFFLPTSSNLSRPLGIVIAHLINPLTISLTLIYGPLILKSFG